MKNKIIKTALSIIVFCIIIQSCTAGENEYGIVKSWYDNQPATVEGAKLKINEPVEIKVEVTSKVDASFIGLMLKEPGVTKSFDVISGPSDFGEWISKDDIKSGWVKTYTWTICPNGNWIDGNAPINIIVQFSKEIDDVLFIRYSIANPHIFDEQYSGSSSSHATTDPSSTNQSQSNSSPSFGIIAALLSVALVVMWRQKNI
ncbi:MAG: sarcinarray family MAST domain-containing protein [Methanosarcinales archaeon]|nr:sarcinarray family MAST domain-containing protein [Methanosarcinales archaeon]